MSLKDSSTYEPFPPDRPKIRRPNDSGELVLLLLAVVLAIAVIFLPNIRRDLLNVLTRPGTSTPDSSAMVWASRQSGNYFCFGSQIYGKGTGSYMTQGDALTRGFQPELGQYCGSGQPKDSKGANEQGIRAPRANNPSPARPASAFPTTK